MMAITHFDCRLCCTILMTTEMISAITTTANNVDKATFTPLLSLTLSPSEQLQVTTEKVTVIVNCSASYSGQVCKTPAEAQDWHMPSNTIRQHPGVGTKSPTL